MSTADPAETTTGARALYETLRACGVTHLFGLDSPEPLYAELDRAEMRPITVRDERAGAIMADAYARVSGRPGVCTAIRGPGATNLITGIGEAWASSTPVVAIVNDVNSALVGKNPIQEVDHLALFRPVTKWAVRLDRPERVAELTARAFALATSGRPVRPWSAAPTTCLTGDAASTGPARPGARRYPSLRVAPDPAAIREAVAVLAEGRPRGHRGRRRGPHLGRVGRAAGGGGPPRRARGDDAPRQGGRRRDPPLSAGVVGAYTGGDLGRGRVANEAVRAADTVLLVGTKTGNVATAGWTVPDPRSRIVHIDIDPQEIGRNYRALGVVGDARLALRALADGLRAAGVASGDRPRHALELGARGVARRVAPLLASAGQAHPAERVVAEMARFVDDGPIVCADASYSSLWAIDLLTLRRPGRRLVSARGFGGIGVGPPGRDRREAGRARAARLVPDRRRRLRVRVPGARDRARYGIGSSWSCSTTAASGSRSTPRSSHYGRTFETKLLDVDYGALARTLHCDGVSVADPTTSRPRWPGRWPPAAPP